MKSYARRAACLAIALSLGACASTSGQDTVAGDYLSGRFAARFNQLDAAADAFARATTLAPGEEKLLRDAFFFRLAGGEIEAAAPYAQAMIDAGVSDSSGLSRLTLAAQALKRGDHPGFETALDGEFEEPLVRSVAQMMRVWEAAGRAGPEAGLAILVSGGDDLFKGFNPTHEAILHEMAGSLSAARASHEASARGFGGPVGRAAFGAFLERHGDEQNARNYYETLAQTPGPQRHAAEAGLARLDAGRPSKAYQSLTPSQGVAIALYSFAGAIVEQTVMQRERATAAGFNLSDPQYNLPLALAQLATYLDPALAEARRLAGSVFNIYGDHERAAAALAAIPPGSPYFEQARIEIAVGQYEAKDATTALRTLEDVIGRLPHAMESRLTLANLYAAENDHSNAVKVASVAIERLPDDPREDAWRYYIVRAASLLELDRWPDAEADLKRAVAIAPEEPTTLNYLGYSWAERGVNLKEAFDLIEKALALQPSSGAITDSLGWAHYQLGEYEEAVVHLERAASLEPADPTITDHLGDAYWRLGREREASYQWRHALSLEPDAVLQAALERKLADGLEAGHAGTADGAEPRR